MEWIFRMIFAPIEGWVYKACAELYDLMLMIASAEVFKEQTIIKFSERIYQLLGLIMLFKLIFSFMTYVINPDDIANKDKGVPNILKKIIIAFCLIVITPWAFKESRELQYTIIQDNLIEYFVFGTIKPTQATQGYDFMHTVGRLFVKPYECTTDTDCNLNEDIRPTLSTCDLLEIPYVNENGIVLIDENDTEKNRCRYGLATQQDADPSNNALLLGKTVRKAKYPGADGKYDLVSLMHLGSIAPGNPIDWIFGGGAKFAFEYNFFYSVLTTVFILWMLIVMLVDIAVRSVKLSFYEIIAPIPIVSYIGLKDGKDSMLNKWFTQVLKTYADLFVRILGLQFASFFIGLVGDANLGTNDNIFVRIFLYIGALTFAKELPKILESMGIKFDGGGFNIKKKYSAASPLFGAVAGALGGISGNYMAARASDKGFIRSSFSALSGAMTGTYRGLKAGIKDKDGLGITKGYSAAGKGGQKIIARQGTNFFDRKMAWVQQRLGVDTKADVLKKRFDSEDEYAKIFKEAGEYALSEASKDSSFVVRDVRYKDANGNEQTASAVNLARTRIALERAKQSGAPTRQIVLLENKLAAAEKATKSQFMDDNRNKDPRIRAYYEQLNQKAEDAGLGRISNFSDAQKENERIKQRMPDRYSKATIRAQRDKEYSKPKGGK